MLEDLSELGFGRFRGRAIGRQEDGEPGELRVEGDHRVASLLAGRFSPRLRIWSRAGAGRIQRAPTRTAPGINFRVKRWRQ
jgi:hypothetical protein